MKSNGELYKLCKIRKRRHEFIILNNITHDARTWTENLKPVLILIEIEEYDYDYFLIKDSAITLLSIPYLPQSNDNM